MVSSIIVLFCYFNCSVLFVLVCWAQVSCTALSALLAVCVCCRRRCFKSRHPYFLGHTSASVVTLDPCTAWAHVDVGTGSQYPPPRYSNMVPTGHVTEPWIRHDGQQPIGGNASNPSYMDDEAKALDPQNCSVYIIYYINICSSTMCHHCDQIAEAERLSFFFSECVCLTWHWGLPYEVRL